VLENCLPNIYLQLQALKKIEFHQKHNMHYNAYNKE